MSSEFFYLNSSKAGLSRLRTSSYRCLVLIISPIVGPTQSFKQIVRSVGYQYDTTPNNWHISPQIGAVVPTVHSGTPVTLGVSYNSKWGLSDPLTLKLQDAFLLLIFIFNWLWIDLWVLLIYCYWRDTKV